jgi:hypothetical protein
MSTEMINASDARREDKIKVSAQDVAMQRQAMKKAVAAAALAAAEGEAPRKGGDGRKKPGRKRGRKAELLVKGTPPVIHGRG